MTGNGDPSGAPQGRSTPSEGSGRPHEPAEPAFDAGSLASAVLQSVTERETECTTREETLGSAIESAQVSVDELARAEQDLRLQQAQATTSREGLVRHGLPAAGPHADTQCVRLVPRAQRVEEELCERAGGA